VIVTEQCGIAPLLANEAGLVVPHEVDALSKALALILDDTKLHGQLTAGCAKVTLRLGWEGPVREMEGLYATLVSQQALK
jgi:hypothetical protein